MLLSHSSNKVPEFIKVPEFYGFRIDEEDNGQVPVKCHNR